MGQSLLRLAGERQDLHLAAAVARNVDQRVEGIPWFRASELAGAPRFDVAIDFSRSEAFDDILALCFERASAFVSGTTALTDAQTSALVAASTRIPILWASNFSLGVAVLAELVERAARASPGWDCDIVERTTPKLDAPSGTALTLARDRPPAGRRTALCVAPRRRHRRRALRAVRH